MSNLFNFIQNDFPMGPIECFVYLHRLVFKEIGGLKNKLRSPPWKKSKIVEIEQGLIQGRRYKLGKEFVDAYMGIPFGKAPVGELRYQLSFFKPLPAEPWKEVRNCTEFGPRCPQFELIFEKYPSIAEKSEDCLRLNVFAPSWDPASCGQVSSILKFYYLFEIINALCCKDVIVVTIQYRLGFYGFSCGEGITPNCGLWDQTLALKWVHQNIHAFNGDPTNITIFGQSAGAASADFLCLSPHSRNLFQRVITMGGSALCSFAQNDIEHVYTVCMDFAKFRGYNPSSGQPLVDFLRQLPASSLELGLTGKRVNKFGEIDLTPVYDGDFFPRPFDELRKEVPPKCFLSGITEHEGLLFVGARPNRKTPLHIEVEAAIERELQFHKVNNIDCVKKKLLQMYWREMEKYNKEKLERTCIKIVSDIYINNGVWLHTDTMTKLGHTVYQYCFKYFNPNGFGLLALLLPYKGATHGTGLPFIFKKGIVSNFYPNEDDLKMVETMTMYFTNFAKYGNPNGVSDDVPELWKPLIPENTLVYMSIDLNEIEMREFINDGRSLFWKELINADAANIALNCIDCKLVNTKDKFI
uniref:Carboxylesterase type B domain-containing protein n=1 Tax=Panagrolaimus sp. ES5 TaxID=591445 RepID=A0AC34F5X6_9BILA